MRSIQRAISRHTSPSHTLTPQLLRTSRPDRAGGRRSPLGFHIGPTNRALTFQLPNHPWQIKDCYSDGSQRCWTAVAGALHPRGYPTSSITERACRHYLERLCIAAQRPKEHASATSLRIVSNTPLPRSLEAPTQQFACVCVSNPVSRKFYNQISSRGVEQACRAPLNKGLCSVPRIPLGTSSDVPAL